MRIAVIPARGGSKRIPQKNIKPFNGRPIITWAIDVAVNSKLFDKIIVSTDDLEIQAVSEKNGATVPFIRPAELSDDYAPTVPVICHAIEWALHTGLNVTEACCIYPTAPFVQAVDLRQGLKVLKQSSCDYVFAATEYAFPIQRAISLRKHGYVEILDPEMYAKRSQDLKPMYHDAGQFYWGTRNAWLKNENIINERSKIVKIPRYRVQDIDNNDDWTQAELLYQVLKNRNLIE